MKRKKINSQNILGIVDSITSPARKISFKINRRGGGIRSYVVKDERGGRYSGRYSISVTDHFGVNNSETETYVYFFDGFEHYFEGLFSGTISPAEFLKEFDNYFWRGNVGVHHHYNYNPA